MNKLTRGNNLTIIRGLPGSGKSTLGRRIAAESGAIFVEPDMFLIHQGEYRWSVNRYEEAVRKALFLIKKAECDVVYADVLPTRADVMRVYNSFYFCQYDRLRGVECRIISLKTSVEESERNNIHNVNHADIRRFSAAWETFPSEDVRDVSEFLFYEPIQGAKP